MSLPDNVIHLDDFEVVAIPGKGVWIADSVGNCWHVAGPYPGYQKGNKLAQAYREAVE